MASLGHNELTHWSLWENLLAIWLAWYIYPDICISIKMMLKSGSLSGQCPLMICQYSSVSWLASKQVVEVWKSLSCCPACRTSLIATRFWVVMICPIIKCLTVLEFSFILFDLCLFITIFNFISNYVPIVTFWIFTYHKIWILLIIFCFKWSYWIIYFLTCLEVFWSVVS